MTDRESRPEFITPFDASAPLLPAEQHHEYDPANTPAAVPNAVAVSPVAAAGQRIVTCDGVEIGHVREVTETFIHVDAPKEEDYWLEASLAADNDEDEVRLTIANDEVTAFKHADPASGDSMLDASEQLDQRRRMEAELAAQALLRGDAERNENEDQQVREEAMPRGA